VPYTFVAEASAGLGASPDPAWEAIFQLMSLRNSTPACTRARLARTQGVSMTRSPDGVLVSWAQRVVSRSAVWIGAALQRATRSLLSWLVTSGQPPPRSPTNADVGTRTSW